MHEEEPFQDHRRYDLRESEPDPERRLQEVEDELYNIIDVDVLGASVSMDTTGPYLEVEVDAGYPESTLEEIAMQYGCRVVSMNASEGTVTVEIKPE